ncbi:MAG TPA: glycosyltransferase family 2 protein [Terriglobia bacterium]|nr:glycosyltransferase family 2 protein [Terriglobia bacterium]
MISVIIPTYEEADSIQDVIRRSGMALAASGEQYELIVVDDNSGDGTAELAEGLSSEFHVRVLRRAGRLGLATAVADGWKLARGDLLGVIDADLQHPPEILVALAAALRQSNADLAIASRYIAGGGTTDWEFIRRVISGGATHLAASVLPLKLSAVSDPMSGMFVVRAAAISGLELSPLGYKILLEVLARGRIEHIVEVAYQFEERARGASKLGARQYAEYLAHLVRLAVATGQFRAWVLYSLVGFTGAVVDIGLIYWLAARAGANVLWVVPLAVEVALLWNFLWNQHVTFARRRRGSGEGGVISRLWRYQKVCLPGAILNIVLTLVLASQGVELIVSAMAGVVLDGVVNLACNVPSIWKIWGSRTSTSSGRVGNQSGVEDSRSEFSSTHPHF